MASRKDRRRPANVAPDVKLSKFLSYVCRHGAEKAGLEISKGGFLAVSAILALRDGAGYTVEDVKRVVSNCPKQRFLLREDDQSGELQIRANQGHSMEVEDLELIPIRSVLEAPVVVHGTNKKAWQLIKDQGLKRMRRNHIHFATGLPGESSVISGMRSSCQVFIYINLEKALRDGLEFFRSANDVILSQGNEEGVILPCYFERIVEL